MQCACDIWSVDFRGGKKKESIEIEMCVLIFPTIYIRNISPKNSLARYYHKCAKVFK